MPLDRPATIRLTAPGARNEHGEFVPGAVTDYRVWLTRVAAPAERDVTAEGVRPSSDGRFRVRWFRELATYDLELTAHLLLDGDTWRLLTVDEVDAADVRTDQQRALRSRHRWLEVIAARVPT